MGRKRLDRGRMTVFAVRNRRRGGAWGQRDTAILCGPDQYCGTLAIKVWNVLSSNASHAAATEHIAREASWTMPPKPA